MSLTSCLKKSPLSGEDKASIKSLAKEYRENEGMARKDAGIAAVQDTIDETLAERAEIGAYVEKRGGVMPDAPGVVKPIAAPSPVAAPVKAEPKKPKKEGIHAKFIQELGIKKGSTLQFTRKFDYLKAGVDYQVNQITDTEIFVQNAETGGQTNVRISVAKAQHKKDPLIVVKAPEAEQSKPDQKNITFSESKRAGKGLSVAEVQKFIAPALLKRFSGPTVEVVGSISSLPGAMPELAGDKHVDGVYSTLNKTVYLVSGNIYSERQAMEVLDHESVGHYSMEEMLGDDFKSILDKVQQLKQSGDKTVSDIADDVLNRYGDINADVESREIIAVMAEKGIDSPLMKRIYAAIQKFLRSIGINRTFTATELQGIVARAANELGRPRPGGKGKGGVSLSVSDRISFSQSNRKYTKEQQDAIEKGGFGEVGKEESALKQALGQAQGALDEAKQQWKTKLRQGFLDQYDSFRTILEDKRAWMMANLTSSSGGVIEATLEYGQPFMNNGAVDVDVNKKSLSKILEPLGAEVGDWLKWIAGNRAERLATEDRERLFSDVNIAALKTLNQGTMEDGRKRQAVYESARVEFEKLNDAIVKIGVDTGIISQGNRQIWKQEGFYVPFYRLAEDEGGDKIRGPSSAGGLVKQTAYKQLKGADIPLNDLLTNVVMNWSHVVQAGLKNQAAMVALDSAEGMGLAEQVEEKVKAKDAVFIRVAGNKLWYNLDSSTEGQLVLESLMSLNYEGLNNFMMKAARKFKRLLTYGVTASPEFKARNLVRDSIQAIAVADMSTNIAKNIVQGFRATKKGNPTIARMIAGGGAFGDSGYIHGSDPEALKRLIEKDVDRLTILDSQKNIRKMWDAYQDFGARLENVNRAANFEQDISRNSVDLLTANFNARDHLDFQRTGAFKSIRIIAQVVPFLNARLQGLSKLGRAANDPAQRKQFAAVVGVYSMASVLLYLYMKDDEDYQEAEEWEKDSYHLFKIPGSDVMYRIPRPFEVGFMASMAERAMEQMVDDKVHGKLFFERAWHGLSETLSFNPMPQMVMPAIEVWANKNTFTDRQIESQSMQSLSPSERRRAWTSDTAIAMSKGFDAILWDQVVLSPVQIEHLVNGYLGWVGGTVLESIDMIARTGGLAPSIPTRRVQDYPVVGAFARTGPSRGSKYTTQFYENMRDAERAYADIRFHMQLGNEEKAKALAEKNKDLIKLRGIYTRANKALSKINKAVLMTRIKDIPSDEKQEELDRLNRMKNEITRRIIEKTASQ